MNPALSFSLKDNIKNIFFDLIDFVYPPFCVVCGKHLLREKKDICSNCFESLEVLPEKYCPICKNFLPLEIEKCPNHFVYSNLSWVYSLGVFDDYYRPIIHSFKYRNKLHLGKRVGAKLGEVVCQKLNLHNFDLVIPVPLHKKRKKKRGFNQSEILAEEMTQKISLPIYSTSLKRIINTKDQTVLSPQERRENVLGAFSVIEPEKIKGKNILLVDDVITTGATLNECAKVLLQNGAKKVSAITLALSMEAV